MSNQPDESTDTTTATELGEFLAGMEGGDVLVISKRPGGKWTVTSICGDGIVVTGFGTTFDEAWNSEL